MNFHNNHVQAEKTLQEVGGARYQYLSLSTRRGIGNDVCLDLVCAVYNEQTNECILAYFQ
ncbi:hypothetical protein NQ317_013343 [Molorchus minor]|uniref:Uncharacterized protein n=1 Tax=Molorchus minor TaxID=1323400 RepID=A0ABQ9IW97_9CUCU|nr:hypothetical protein NQ317_013343 [Molorchus minor]